MGKTSRLGCVVLAAIAVALTSQAAQAGLVVDVLSGGSTSGSVDVGGSITLDVVLTSDAQDTFDSFGLDVLFSAPGLSYDAYRLAAPAFSTADPSTDFSDAASGPLAGGIWFEAVTAVGGTTFGEGTLISFDVSVPDTFIPGDMVEISAAPDFFALGFGGPEGVAGESFMLNVTPEPATLALLGIGGVLAMRRRRNA